MAAIMAGLVFFNHGIIATGTLYLTEAKIGIIDQYVALGSMAGKVSSVVKKYQQI